MKKKDTKKPVLKGGKNQKKEKKQKDPKEYIPQNLMQNLREAKSILTLDNSNQKEDDENKNCSPDYKPEHIPCKIPEEWESTTEEEINNEYLQYEKENAELNQENNINDTNPNTKKNQNLKDNKKEDKKDDKKKDKDKDKDKEKNKNAKNKEKEKDKDGKNKKSEENKNENNEQNSEEEDGQPEVDPEIMKKLNHIIRYEDDSERFIDPDDQMIKDNLPLYLVDILRNEIKWKRPKKYIMHYYLWEKVKIQFPKKKISVICDEIIDTYKDYLLKVINGEIINDDEEDKNLNEYLSNKTDSIKNRIYKEFFPIIDKDYNIKIADSIQRVETDAEFQQRKDTEEKTSKTSKNKKSVLKKKDITEEKIMVNDLKPSDLKLNTNPNFSNSFYTWMTSIFQFIFDNNITDLNSRKSILYNIYPQKDGVPVYNPKGKYVIKLYLMGKERKVVIDDSIPFTYDDEFVFPGCEDIKEIWPVLFTKAIIKLNIYKYRHPNYFRNEEFNDVSFIYNLTGKHVFKFNLYEPQINTLLLQEYNELVSNYSTKYIFGFYKTAKTRSMKITQIYQSYDERINDLNNRLIEKEKSKHLIPLYQSINSGANQSKKTKPRIKFKEDNIAAPRTKNLEAGANIDGSTFKRRQKKFTTLSVNSPKKLVNSLRIQEENLIDAGIVKNFLYTMSDYFESKNYNLRRTQKVFFNDIKNENEETKWEFKQLNINEKKEYMIRRRDMKRRHHEERAKRIEQLKKTPHNNEYKLFKINSNCTNLPTNYQCFDLYNDKEISMGRKCLANKWEFPPMEFFTFDELPPFPFPENSDKKNIKNNEEYLKYRKMKKNMALYGWTLDNFKELAQGNYIEEKDLDASSIVKTRNSSDRPGIWYDNASINQLFDTMLLIFNDEELYKNNLLCDNGYYNYLTDVYEPLEEYQAFYLINEKLLPENMPDLKNDNKNIKQTNKNLNRLKSRSNITPNIENKENNTEKKNETSESMGIDIMFQPYIEQLYLHEQPKVYLMPYINIDIYDCETQSKIYSKLTLNHFYSTFYSDKFDNKSGYYIIITDGYFPMGYILNIASKEFSIKNMTRNKFYQQILNYKTQEFTLDFPYLEKNRLWLFGKIALTNNTTTKSMIHFKLNINYQIKQIFPYIKVFLENQNMKEKRREIMLDEFITLEQENTEEVKVKDYITILIKPEYALKGSSIDVEILYDNEEFNFELLDLVSPYEITGGTSESNHNGLIFSEYIYPSENEVVSFLDLSVREIENEEEKLIENGEIDFKLELYELLNEPNINFEQDSIHFSYSNIGNLLKSWVFYNDINLTNIVFYTRKVLPKEEPQITDSNKKNNKSKKKVTPPPKGKKEEAILPYVLICYVNDRYNNKFKFDNIQWRMRIFTDNIISFVKDTSKISHEEKIKNEWEINQPGRKLKASDSRKKYLLFGKQMRGADLTEEEKQILNKERKRSTDIEPEEIAVEAKKNAKHSKQSRNKANSSIKDNNNKNNHQSQTTNESSNIMYTKINKLPIIHSRYLLDTNQFKMNRILKENKKIENCHSIYISNYMNYINQNRVIHYEGLQKNISVLNKDEIEKFNKKILNDFDQSEKIIKQDNYFVKSKDDNDDIDDKKFNRFLNKFGSVRIKASDSMKNLMVKRNYLNKDIVDRISIERKLKEIFDMYKSSSNASKDASMTTKVDMDINDMMNTLEKAKEILPSSDSRLEELASIIEMKKEEIANTSIKTKPKKK